MKITNIDRAACRQIREAIEENLAALGEELGIQFSAKGGSYDSGQVTFKVECAVIAEDGQAQTREAGDFKLSCYHYGLSPDDLFREFKGFDGKRYKIVGLKPRSHRYPILCEKIGHGNGKRVKFTGAQVKSALDKMAVA